MVTNVKSFVSYSLYSFSGCFNKDVYFGPPRRRVRFVKGSAGRKESIVWRARRLVALLPSSRALLNKSY